MEQKEHKGGFARVRVTANDSQTNVKQSNSRSQYLKLAYPNGVTLTLPVDISSEMLCRYIHAAD